MVVSRYEYTLTFFRADGSAMGQVAVRPDWDPAVQAAAFQALRRDRRLTGLPAVSAARPARIEPIWNSVADSPWIEAFEAAVDVPGADPVNCRFRCELAYFDDLGAVAAERLRKQGLAEEGDTLRYAVRADLAPVVEGGGQHPSRFRLAEAELDLGLERMSAAVLRYGSLESGQSAREDHPVFIPRRVIESAARIVRAASDRETGAFLLGFLRLDAETADVFAEVTAVLPARETVESLTRLTFTPECWNTVRREIRARNRQELLLGWVHSHPVAAWLHSPERVEAPSGRAEGPPPESPGRAGAGSPTLSGDFFSAEDCRVQRACFNRAYQFGLLAVDGGDDLRWHLFGWRGGQVTSRGFFVTHSAVCSQQPDPKDEHDLDKTNKADIGHTPIRPHSHAPTPGSRGEQQ